MRSVQDWAAANAYEYVLLDDRLFDLAPAWYRHRAQQQICPVTDLARLVQAKQFLQQGYERTVWVDADVVVFDPDRFMVDAAADFAFCHEVWVSEGNAGETLCGHRVNNAVSVFNRGNSALDFLIDACLRIAASKPALGKLDVGTSLLTGLRGIMPFHLIGNVGMFSPAIIRELADGTARHLPELMSNVAVPFAAGNLCASLTGVTGDQACERVVQLCTESRGDIINRHFVTGNARVRDYVHAGQHNASEFSKNA